MEEAESSRSRHKVMLTFNSWRYPYWTRAGQQHTGRHTALMRIIMTETTVSEQPLSERRSFLPKSDRFS